jgi:hypothetical protein
MKMIKSKHQILFLFLLALSLNMLGQSRTVIHSYTQEKSIYIIQNGRLTGKYISYYHNGIKKSEGQLINGYRNGKWIVWDSTGRKRMERVYKNPLEYKRIFPSIPNEGAIPLLIRNQYKMEPDSNGVIKYAQLKAENAIWRHKFWRYLEPYNNEVLFTGNRFLEVIKNLALSGKIELFDAVDDRFSTVLSKQNVENIFNYKNAKLESIEIKEELIFDMERLVFEYRILGFRPVFSSNNDHKLFWVYYPDLRKYFGKQLIEDSRTRNITTLDDLFIFRDFSSLLIKTTIDNPYDRFFKDYPGVNKELLSQMQEEFEMQIIEEENNIWLSLTK